MDSNTKSKDFRKLLLTIAFSVIFILVATIIVSVDHYNNESIASRKVSQSTIVLFSVDCLNIETCFAVGGNLTASSSSLLSTSNGGKTWTLVHVNFKAKQLQLVACSKLSSYCIVSGQQNNKSVLLRYYNLKWSLVALPVNIYINAMSCGEMICKVAGSINNNIYNADILSFNGSSWQIENLPKSITNIKSISCTSPTFCIAFADGLPEKSNFMTNYHYVLTFNGFSWQIENLPKSITNIKSISCTSPTFCVAGINKPEFSYLEFNGGKWLIVHLSSQFKNIGIVKCLSNKYCIAIASFSRAKNLSSLAFNSIAVFNGIQWKLGSLPS